MVNDDGERNSEGRERIKEEKRKDKKGPQWEELEKKKKERKKWSSVGQK